MRKKLLLLLLLLSGSVSFAQEVVISETRIKEVTVFLARAEVRHEATVRLKAGSNQVTITGLPASLRPQSINVMAGERAKIVSVSNEFNSGTSAKRTPLYLGVKDSANYYKYETEKLENDVAVFDEEKKMVISNNNRIGGKEGVTAAELQSAADFYRSRLREINKNLFELNRKLEKLRPHADRINTRLSRLEAHTPHDSYEVNLVLTAREAHDATLRLSYVAGAAGWTPVYDLRAQGIDKPIQFEYKGEIFNDTGLDWENVKIKLSSSDPSQLMTQPVLTPWRLAFYDQSQQWEMQQRAANNAPVQQSIDISLSNTLPAMDRDVSTAHSDIVVSELNVEFEIKEAYTIPSDNKPYRVDINEYQLKADYKYVCTPKVDKDAFLLAKVTGWESLNLMEGTANIYFNDSYTGQTYINLRNADDTLDVSLGRDKRVIVHRVKKQDFSSKKLISNSKKETQSFDISVRNSNPTPITIEVKDQVPLSGESDIEVAVLETSRGERDGDTGMVTWQLSVPPGESRVVTLTYEIKYPKNKKLSLQKTKVQQQYKH